MSTSLPQIDEIDDQAMMEYLHHFLQIADFKKIQNGKQLLQIIKDNPNHPKVKSAVRKILGLFHTDSPGAKVCSLQFLKEAMETNCWCVVESIQRSLLPKVVEVTEFRPHMRSIQRGSSYFINNFDKNVTDEQVSNLIKLSSTFFRMIHECVYVWGALYFPGTSFDRMRIKLMKRFDFPKYPEEFKFYTDKKIENFKLNCQDVIKKMKQYDDEVMSKTSVEKKRETSVKPSRVSSSMNNKNSRSQSTEKLIPNKKSTKQMQEEINSKKKINNQSPIKNRQASAQIQNSSRKQSQSLTNSSLLRKKNSFSSVQVVKLLAQQKDSTKSQQVKKVNIQHNKKIDEASTQKLRFKTISQQSDSEVGRYSVKESNEQTSQQFSEGDYVYQNRTNESPRSQIQMRRQQNETKLPLKKYISEEISMEVPVKKIISLNEIKRDNKKQNQNHKQGKPSKVSKEISEAQIRKEKSNKKGVREQMKVETEEEQKSKGSLNIQNQINKLNEREQNRIPLKSVPKLPLPKQQKFQQERKKRKDQSARKKFISSEEQNMNKEKQAGQNIQTYTYSDFNQEKKIDNIKEKTANNLRKNEKQQALPQKNTDIKQTNQQPPSKFPQKQNEELINPKPLRLAKPQKIKGSSSSKTVFQGNQYSLVQIVPQAKIATKENSKEILPNINPIKKKEEQVKEKSKPKIALGKDIYKMVQEIEDSEVMTIQLKIIDCEIAVEKHPSINNNQTLIQMQKKESQYELTQKYQSQSKEVKNSLQKIVKIQNIQKKQIRIPNNISVQQASNKFIKQDKQIKINKQISKPDPIRIYSPKRKDQNLEFESPQYSYRKENKQTSETDAKKNTARNNRLKKNQQVCMIIHPKDDILSEVQIKSGKESIDQVKNLLKEQIAEEFAQLRNTFFSQQENIHQTVFQSYTSKLKSQMSHKDKPGVECGIQAKIRQKYKKRVSSIRKYKMFDETEEQRHKHNLNQTISNTIQNDKLNVNKADTTFKGTQTRKSSKNKVSLNPGEYEPNTLLYVLYRRRTLLND